MDKVLGCGTSEATALHMLNRALGHGKEECSVAVDIFSLDLILGEAKFIKSGAACSYIKRKSSLFRIKSETMPIGLIKKVDADGVSSPTDDSPWLVEFLNKPAIRDLNEYAETILELAKKNSKSGDDMSVLVMKVGYEN